MDKKKTGNLIKDARIKKGYTQQELGDLIGVTNKAISRWENGDAFPDVSLLDTLSYTLDLDISEIVLGEKKEKGDNTVALEMAQIARMEKTMRAKLFNSRCIAGLILGLLFFGGIKTIVYGLYGWPVQVIYYGCALCILAVSYVRVRRKNYSLWAEGSVSLLAAVIAGLSTVYGTLLVCGTLALLTNDINILGLADMQIGPFLNYHLLAIFLINFILAVYFIILMIEKDKDISIGLYISIVGMFLSLVYSDLLYRLTSPKDFILIFILDTTVVLTLTVVGILVSHVILVGRSKKQAA